MHHRWWCICHCSVIGKFPAGVHLESPRSGVMCPLTLFQVEGLVSVCGRWTPDPLSRGWVGVGESTIEDNASSSLFCTDFQTSVGGRFPFHPFHSVSPCFLSHFSPCLGYSASPRRKALQTLVWLFDLFSRIVWTGAKCGRRKIAVGVQGRQKIWREKHGEQLH